MRIWTLFLFLGLALAQSPGSILDRASAYLKAAPFVAEVEGRVRMPNGELGEVAFVLKSLPAKRIVRIEFQRPDSLADNFVVVTPKKVYNYLFLTNQLIVYPREKARIEGLGVDFRQLGELEQFRADPGLKLRLGGEAQTPAGPAYRLEGEPEDPERLGVGRYQLWILKDPPRPYRLRVFDLEGNPVADLVWKRFARAKLDEAALLAYPPDAEVIEKR